MVFGRIKIKFSGAGFAQGFIGSKAKRWMNEYIFGPIGGPANLRFLIVKDRDLLKVFPPPLIERARSEAAAHIKPEMLAKFTNGDVYGWIDPLYRQVIESTPNGKPWVDRQLTAIRTELLAIVRPS